MSSKRPARPSVIEDGAALLAHPVFQRRLQQMRSESAQRAAAMLTAAALESVKTLNSLQADFMPPRVRWGSAARSGVSPQVPAAARPGTRPQPLQNRSPERPPRGLVISAPSGFSAKRQEQRGRASALHTALARPDFSCCSEPVAPAIERALPQGLDGFNALGRPLPVVAESALRLELANGSRVVSLPGDEKNIRGYSGVTLLVIDEAARVADELYYAVRPMLAVSQGRLVALSTPSASAAGSTTSGTVTATGNE